ncbi:MAG: MBL fold metallo-hydrolase [Fusicatenibacter sp.]|nr:MBL fold metallo-hydrolase [Lachnospiraceae bacterium]MDY2939298.1 MBL fold metallo-hydrolase [Fusicatenibacter sp.]
MKLKYLGTAAYEGVPSLFCRCRVCRESMKLGGRNLRSRSQALLNDELLLDFPPDTVLHAMRYGLDWDKITDCLITHSHSDHFYPEDVEMASPEYTYEHQPIHFYSALDGYEKLKQVTDRDFMREQAVPHLIEPGKRFTVGTKNQYSVLPLWANHDPATSPVIYSITDGKKRMLYAHDSGIFSEASFEGLASEEHYDLVSLDCTGCLSTGWRDGHMCLETNLEVLERMRSMHLIDDKTIVVLNHFSHNGGQTYDEMQREADRYGILVSYDGMEVEF